MNLHLSNISGCADISPIWPLFNGLPQLIEIQSGTLAAIYTPLKSRKQVFLVHCKSSNVKNVSFLNVNSVLCGKVKALCCSAPFCEDIYISGGEQMGANRLMHGDLAEHPPHFPKANFESLELPLFKGTFLFYVLPSFLIIIVRWPEKGTGLSLVQSSPPIQRISIHLFKLFSKLLNTELNWRFKCDNKRGYW